MTAPNKGYISQLPAASAIGPYDYAVIDQIVSGSPTTRRAALSQLFGLTIKRVTGTTYTLVPNDLLLPTCIIMANAGAMSLTIPTAASLTAGNGGVSLAPGLNFMFQRYGAGSLTIVAAGGVTLRFSSSVTLKNQYSMGFALSTDIANEWSLGGDFT